MKWIRFVVGRMILLLDFLTRPSPVVRSREDQDSVDAVVYLPGSLILKPAHKCTEDELVRGGGKHKVPCLRIEENNKEVRWLYSSDEICKFLDAKLDQLKVV